MNRRSRTRTLLQLALEVSVLALLVAGFITHRLQLWMPVFAAGVILSLFAGRLFCGWVCPMHTIFRGLDWVCSRLHIRRLKTPPLLAKRWVRMVALLLFLAGIAVIQVTAPRVNPLILLIGISVTVTLFFEESFWHAQLCPFGTILSFTSRKAPLGMRIEEGSCIACGRCDTVCPSGAVVKNPDATRSIVRHECLLCYRCADVCPPAVCTVRR